MLHDVCLRYTHWFTILSFLSAVVVCAQGGNVTSESTQHLKYGHVTLGGISPWRKMTNIL
jgi:hypothetical protein